MMDPSELHETTFKENAGFAEVTYAFSDMFEVTAGARPSSLQGCHCGSAGFRPGVALNRRNVYPPDRRHRPAEYNRVSAPDGFGGFRVRQHEEALFPQCGDDRIRRCSRRRA